MNQEIIFSENYLLYWNCKNNSLLIFWNNWLEYYFLTLQLYDRWKALNKYTWLNIFLVLVYKKILAWLLNFKISHFDSYFLN